MRSKEGKRATEVKSWLIYLHCTMVEKPEWAPGPCGAQLEFWVFGGMQGNLNLVCEKGISHLSGTRHLGKRSSPSQPPPRNPTKSWGLHGCVTAACPERFKGSSNLASHLGNSDKWKQSRSPAPCCLCAQLNKLWPAWSNEEPVQRWWAEDQSRLLSISRRSCCCTEGPTQIQVKSLQLALLYWSELRFKGEQNKCNFSHIGKSEVVISGIKVFFQVGLLV